MSVSPLRFRAELLTGFFTELIKDPIGAFRIMPTFTLLERIVLQFVAAEISGLIVGILTRSWLDFWISALVFPFAALAVSAALSFFLQSYFRVVERVSIDFAHWQTLVVVTAFPYFIGHAFAGLLPPMDLIAFATMMIWMTIGLVNAFGIRRRSSFRITGALAAAYFVIWSITQIAAGS